MLRSRTTFDATLLWPPKPQTGYVRIKPPHVSACRPECRQTGTQPRRGRSVPGARDPQAPSRLHVCALRCAPPVRLHGNNQCTLFRRSISATKSSIKRSMPANRNSQCEEIDLRATRWQPNRYLAIGVGNAPYPVDLSEISTTLRAASSGNADFGSKPHEYHIENCGSHEHRGNNGY